MLHITLPVTITWPGLIVEGVLGDAASISWDSYSVCCEMDCRLLRSSGQVQNPG